MEGFFLFLGVVAALTWLGIAAQSWGVDTTDGSTDPRRSPRPTGIS
jgi:hypothetical protein